VNNQDDLLRRLVDIDDDLVDPGAHQLLAAAVRGAQQRVTAIRRAGSDQPEAIEQALKETQMPSRLGGTYKLDDHNHPRTPLFILGLKDGKPTVIATEE
jgi:hypothetical protein